VRVQPASAAHDAAWVTVTAWQGGGLRVDRLARIGDGLYRTNKPIPVYGDWKATFRLQRGRELGAAPVYLPQDAAIPAKEVPASARFARPLVPDIHVLQRERRQDIPGWLWSAACLLVLALALTFLGVLSWGLARVARRSDDDGSASGDEPRFGREGRIQPSAGTSPFVA
jgi:hypothetical protein